MMALPEEVIKQTAATGEQSQHTLASPEFFFLLQRIDRLDEKLTSEIKAGDDRLATEIKALAGEMKALESRLTAEIKAGDERLAAEVKALDGRLTAETKALSGEIKALDDKVSRSLENLRFWAIGAVIAIAVGFIGTIVTLALR